MVKDFLTMGWYNLSQFWEKRPMPPFVRIFAELNKGDIRRTHIIRKSP